jgi:hypothetical protein
VRQRGPKQERRGGIETWSCRQRATGIPPKQESRGGIETRPDLGDLATAGNGSRNAVVALKHSTIAWTIGFAISKQERRGGIETEEGRKGREDVEGKQERRGGIETVLIRFLICKSLNIAAALQRGIPRIR